MAGEESIVKMSIFEQQLQQLEQQAIAIEKQIIEIQSLHFNLKKIKEFKGEEFLSNIGNGVFVKSKLINKELLIDIGQGKLLAKGIDDAGKIFELRLNELGQARAKLQEESHKIYLEIESLVNEARNQEKNDDSKNKK